jgi:hypothetical protein
MANIEKTLEVLGLHDHFARFDGQVQTRVTRSITVYEITDTTGPLPVNRYEVEFRDGIAAPFGLYPLNYIAGMLHHGNYTDAGETPQGYLLHRPSVWVVHPEMSGLAGQNVYYVDGKLLLNEDRIEQMFEPYETTLNGVALDMNDPVMRVQYKARIVKAGKVVWTSRFAITPKKRLRRSEFLSLCGLTMDEVIYKSRWTYNIVKTNPATHINNIAMDIERTGNQVKSTAYINGEPSNSFNYKTLINSFGKTYSGFMQMYRLYNGPGLNVTDNVYGSTLNIGLDPAKDTTINIQAGTVNAFDAKTKTLTFNPDLKESAELLAYMEFLPAQGKNENIGQSINLETGEEKLF